MKTDDFCSPLTGEILPLEEVPDEAFSSHSLGEGFAVEISGDEIVAPFAGTVTALYPTGHAVCLESTEGIQVMIHAGLDSYQAAGLNRALVRQGQHVDKGQLLVRTDVEKMKALGISRISPVVFLNHETITLCRVHVPVRCREEGIAEIRTAEEN